jgi:hypothetical protein
MVIEMKNEVKILFPTIIILLILGTSVSFGNANTDVEPKQGTPLGIERPQGVLASKIGKNFLTFIRGLRSANFTEDNVYYNVNNDVGQYGYNIRNMDNKITQINEIRMSRITKQINKTLNLLKLNLTGDVTPEVLNYFTKLYNEVSSHSSLGVNHSIDSNLNVVTVVDRKVVTIFFDPDRSVIKALETIKENGTVNTQPFTGDEIFTSVFLSLIRDKISGSHEVSNLWSYENGTPAYRLKDFMVKLTRNRWLLRELNFLHRSFDIGILKALVAPNHLFLVIPANNPKTLSYGKFSVSKLIIDKLDLKKIGNALVTTNFDYRYIEHQMLGNLIYNDTNGNGYMDIGSKNVTIGARTFAVPTIGDEVLYRFDIRAIENRSYTAPKTTDDILEFGSEFGGIHGYLNPIGLNRDDALFNDTESLAGRQDIDKISTMFHFSITENSSVQLKFDYYIGEWTESDRLEGLSFNQILSTTVIDSEKTVWRRGNNTEISDDIENSTKVSRMRFGASGVQPFGEIRLDDIPYTWDSSTQTNAVGQLLPLNLISMTFGGVSSESDQIIGVMRSVNRRTYLYSVSYPKWDGKSILHDPVYVAAGGAGADISAEAPIPGFEFPTLILTLSVLAVPIIIRKRKRI